jgi:hypothetical protein
MTYFFYLWLLLVFDREHIIFKNDQKTETPLLSDNFMGQKEMKDLNHMF